MSEKSVEQVVRDILQSAFDEGLIHLLDADSDGVPPSEMSSGDLVGPANILEQYVNARLAAEVAELRKVVAAQTPHI